MECENLVDQLASYNYNHCTLTEVVKLRSKDPTLLFSVRMSLTVEINAMHRR